MSDPTAVEPTSPFDLTDRESDTGSDLARHTQLSDPPTVFVHRDSVVELPPGSVVDDLYEIDAKLGAGAMGEVYAARHVKLGKRVAIKVIGPRLSEDTTAIDRFAMEARTLAKIQHPAIVTVDHVGELADGRAYFVMEYLHGESLLERNQRGRVPFPEALRILDQIARGLEAAHAQGVIHRDLKPENIYLAYLPGELPIIKLLDFGLSKLAADVIDRDRRAESTQSGVAIGTPLYMSPEQVRGPDVDPRTDVYALGCLAYELLLGRRPFPDAKTAPALFAAHLHESPPLPRSIWPEIPPQLDLALFAMLAKDPAHRPTLAQIRAVLEAVRMATPSQRAKTELVVPKPRNMRRHAWRKWSVSVAFAMTTLFIGILIGKALVTRTTAPRVEPARDAPIVTPLLEPPPPYVNETSRTTPSPTTPPVSRTRSPKPKTSKNADGSGATTVDAVPAASKAPDIGSNKPLDKNQTVNPFDKRDKANP